MNNFTDSSLFEKIEGKVESDVYKSWSGNSHNWGGNDNPNDTSHTGGNTIKSSNNANGTAQKKQLVILAGPQLSQTQQSIREFFVVHASPYRPQQHAASLAGWTWPKVDPQKLPVRARDTPHARIFDLLFTDEDEEASRILLDAVEDEWNQASQGVIIGSDYFDQTPYSIERIRDVVQRVSVDDPSEQVTVVLSYPGSPVEHWSRFYHLSGKNVSYADWICDPAMEESHLQRLESSMNILGLATVFRLQSWRVVVLDEIGLWEAQQHPAHVVACRVLTGTDCLRGWVQGVNYRDAMDASTLWSSTAATIAGLSSVQLESLNELFHKRDCIFQKSSMHDAQGFEVLFDSQIGNNCLLEEDLLPDDFPPWINIQHMWQQIQSQVDCTPKTNIIDNFTTSNSPSQQTSLDILQMTTVLVALLAAVVVLAALRYRRSRRVQEQRSLVLRQWTTTPLSSTLKPFSTSTLSSSVLTSSSSTTSKPHQNYPYCDQEHNQEQELEGQYDPEDPEQQMFEEIDLTTVGDENEEGVGVMM